MSTHRGSTCEPIDIIRLNTLQQRVMALMSDGAWRTLRGIANVCGGSEAGVSARLREARWPENGWIVDRRRVEGGLFEYRMRKPEPNELQPSLFT